MTPEKASALMQDAIKLQQQGQHQQALDIYEEMRRHYPKHPDLLHNLALAYAFVGQPAVAERLFLRVLELAPKLTQARSNLVKLWTKMDRLQTLREIAHDEYWVLALDEASGAALGAYFFAREDYSDAIPALLKSIDIAPKRADLQHMLGRALYRSNYAEDAESHFRSALMLEPQDPRIMIELAQCLFSIYLRFKNKKCLIERRELVEKAILLAPDDVHIRHELGLIYEEDGDFEKAKDFFREVLSSAPDFLPSLTHLASVSRADAPEALLAELEGALEKESSFSYQERCRAYQALGKCYDVKRNYDKAFECFQSGNEIAAEIFSFNQSDHENYIQNLMDTYSSDAIEQFWPKATAPDKPIFIVGMPRSGTTLLEYMLSGHPEIEGAGEVPFFIGRERLGKSFHTTDGKPGFDWTEKSLSEASSDLRNRFDAILDEVDASVAHVVDKMPFNFTQLGAMAHVYPGAKIIHCKRNKLDVCLSCFSESFSDGHTWSLRLKDIAFYYAQYEKLMEHWKQVFGCQIYDLEYGNLVENPEATLQDIARFLDIDWSDELLSYAAKKRSIRTPSNWQVRQPIYKTSQERWRHYEQHLGPLLNES
ncbi:MAG: sulfotransferase [Kordiimonadaceae bacterium]|nr:sulfotransferase [Kordiimonadaceae bacterium]